jgi:hypothetical protein
MKIPRAKYRILSVVFIILAGAIFAFSFSDTTKYNTDFSTSFDVFSVDNFYDNEQQSFSGEKTSFSTFSYNAVDKIDGVLLIENLFEIRTQEGALIASFERLYGIDPQTGRHVPGYGDRERDGFLFGPTRSNSKNSFVYWHTNYDGPAFMTFNGQERLYGLKADRYTTNYQGVRIDQTANLTHLPGVPEERGIILEPELTIWVEARTGRMIKFEDHTTAYYYDRETGERLEPWNRFRNRLNETSVQQNVQAIQARVFSNILQRFIAPVAFLLLAFMFGLPKITRRLLPMPSVRRTVSRAAIVTVLVGAALVIFGWMADIDVLKSVIPGLVTMKFSTATTFVLAVVVVILSDPIVRKQGVSQIFLPVASLTMFIIMGTLFVTSSLGIFSGIENLFVIESADLIAGGVPGRPSYGTMTAFLLIGAAGIDAMYYFGRREHARQLLGVLTTLIGSVALLGYIFEIPLMYYQFTDASSAMAFHTALFFVLLGSALWLQKSQRADQTEV